ncbi:sulfotransferase domain-containing protein [Vibrio coralliirubri]|uniref:sulfotransferase domain-containing protein n=1 Tax=Vibrio coralliirubri TaxID=1516159 RepID=UPI002FE05526
MNKIKKLLENKLFSRINGSIEDMSDRLKMNDEKQRNKFLKLEEKIDLLNDKISTIEIRSNACDLSIRKEQDLRCFFYRQIVTRTIPSSIFVCSIPKCGTTYTINFLANYVTNIDSKYPVQVNFDQLIQNGVFHTVDTPMFTPNVTDLNLYKANVASLLSVNTSISNKSKYSHIIGTHKFQDNYEYNKGVFLYRNPLDFLVSLYNFEYKKKGLEKDFSEMVREKLSGDEFSFVSRYLEQIKLCNATQSLHISYESLMIAPHETFSKILDYLELPIQDELLNQALEYSSIKSVKEFENKSDKILIGSNRGLKGSFITSGKIGQWKDYFDEDLIQYVKVCLEENDIDFDTFVYE